MELSSTINKPWNSIAFFSLGGCLILFFLLNQTHQKLSFFAPLAQLHPPTNGIKPFEPEPSNLTVTKTVTKPLESEPSNMTVEKAIEPEPELEPEPANLTVIKPLEPEPSNLTVNKTVTKPLEPEPSNRTVEKALEPDPEPELEPANLTVIKPLEPEPSNLTVTKTVTKPLEPEPSNMTVEKALEPETETKKRCNIYEGKWVYKPEEEISYDTTRSCLFVDEAVKCRKNGRSDFDYEKWRWEANDCDIPMFNGRDMLERLRDKRVILVGDSLNRNLWESLACLLYSSIHPSRAYVDAKGGNKLFKAKDYNCTVEFYMSPFLVEVETSHKRGRKVLVLDKISSMSNHWRGAHIMVFNSAHWWTHPDSIKAWDIFKFEGKLIEEMPREVAFEQGMKTWAKWVENNVDPKQTRVFFRSVSPTHHGKQLCNNITQPIMDKSFEDHSFPRSLIDVADRLVTGMTKPQVKLLNITKLSSYRRDAHPSMYWTKQLSTATTMADCSHWCLPGLPDTWNRLLYASLVS